MLLSPSMLARWIDFTERLAQHFRRLHCRVEAGAPVAAHFRRFVKRSNDFGEPFSKAFENGPAAHVRLCMLLAKGGWGKCMVASHVVQTHIVRFRLYLATLNIQQNFYESD